MREQASPRHARRVEMRKELDRHELPLTSAAGGGSLIEAARCPRCAAGIDLGAPAIACAGRAGTYPRLGEIPILLTDPTPTWRPVAGG